MSDDLTDVDQLSQAYAPALSGDVGGLIGAEIQIESPVVDEVDRAGLAGSGEALLHTPAGVQADEGGSVHLLMGRHEAAVLAGLLMGLDKDAIPEREKQGFDEELLTSYGEVVKAACSALARVHQELGLPGFESGASAEVSAPRESDDWLPDGRYRRIGFTLRLPDDLGEGRVAVAIPKEVADRWFGAAGGSSGEEAEPAVEMGAVVVIDGDEDARHQAEELEDSAGWTVWTFDSSEFGLDSFEEVSEASAILVEWDLGGYSALDLVESLLQDPRTNPIPVVVVSSTPTKAIVKAAIRAGARGFAFKPYDAQELALRLAPFIPQLAAARRDEPEVTEPESAPEADETGEPAPESAEGAEA